jgi:hypothetical protein
MASEGVVEVAVELTDGGGKHHELVVAINIFDAPETTSPAMCVVNCAVGNRQQPTWAMQRCMGVDG